ncbi:MAG: hypothetical protein AAF600_02560 [Bacteroidota bacterium]
MNFYIKQEIRSWVLEHFQNPYMLTDFGYDFNEVHNICTLEIQWHPKEKGEHPTLIAQYEGIYDESFFTLARLDLERHLFYRVNCLAPHLKHLFSNLLN